MLLFAFFMLPTRIHERYLFPAIVFLVLLVPFIKKMRPIYIALTATLFVNQAYVLYWFNLYKQQGLEYSPNLTGDPVVLAISAINLILFIYASILLWGELKGRPIQETAQTPKATVKQTENNEGTVKWSLT